MKHCTTPLLFLCAALALLTACRTAEQGPARSNAEAGNSSGIARLFNDYYEERLKLYAMEATLAGDDRYNDLLPNNLTESYRASCAAFYRKYLTALGHVDRGQLSAEDQIGCDILKWECETQLKQLQFPTHLMPINQFWSLHLDIGQWAGGTAAQPFKTVRDYDNWLKRLDAFTEWCHTAVENMRQGMKRGYLLPKALTQKIIPQMAAMTKSPAEEHPFYAPIKLMPAGFTDADRTRLTGAYVAMIRDKIIPAFRQLEEFLSTEYLPASRDSSGISAIPNGREYYQSQIEWFTTTELSAEEIFDLGQREVARISAEMEQVKARLGFTGDLKAFFELVRNRK